MNAYAIAFAIGYYYGRAYSIDESVTIPAQDQYHRQNQGFMDGLEAGRRDFQEIDLPISAMQEDTCSLGIAPGVTIKGI